MTQDYIVVLEEEEVDVVVDKEQVQRKHQKRLQEPVLEEEGAQFVSVEVYGTGEGEREVAVNVGEAEQD